MTNAWYEVKREMRIRNSVIRIFSLCPIQDWPRLAWNMIGATWRLYLYEGLKFATMSLAVLVFAVLIFAL
jgi:hypothetical protein